MQKAEQRPVQKVPLTELSYLVRNVLAIVDMEDKKESATILALRGELGAGKTTFVQQLAKEIGYYGTLQSPTYVLMKSYPISFKHFTTLVHIDAYRLEKPEEFTALKPGTFLQDSHTLVCVEWPERLEGVLPTPDLSISFSSEGAEDKERFIEIQ